VIKPRIDSTRIAKQDSLQKNLIIALPEAEQTFNGGVIVIPETSKEEPPDQAIVQKVGPDCVRGAKAGDLVYFHTYSKTPFPQCGTSVYFINEDALLSIEHKE
jgi:co-chaperonin GroES (HSP10)